MAGAQRALGSASGPPGGPSRRATGYAVAVLCLLLAARLSAVVTAGELGQVPFTVALFVLPQLLYTFRGTRPLLDRYRWPVLAVQAVLTWVPFALFGAGWQDGIGGLLAGLVLLMVPGRVWWATGRRAAGGRGDVAGLWDRPAAAGGLDGRPVDGHLLRGRRAGVLRDGPAGADRRRGGTGTRPGGGSRGGAGAAAGRRVAAGSGRRAAGRCGGEGRGGGRALSRDAAQARAQIAAAGVAARDAVAQARR